MAVRQYIGARYVTKIYENSLDPSSAEWEAGVNYEPLVMVTYNNGSYLSKKNVPASVGDPAANTAYWVQTGFYNGQIAALQAAVSSLTERVDILDLGIIFPETYGAVADGVTDCTGAIQQAIDENPHSAIYFGGGVYSVNNTLSGVEGIHFIIAPNSTIRADSAMDVLIYTDIVESTGDASARDRSTFITGGGIIDCNYKANYAIGHNNCIGATFENLNIKNFNVAGIHNRFRYDGVDTGVSASNYYNDLYIMIESPTYNANTYGIIANGQDCIFDTIGILNCKTGFYCKHSGHILNGVHPWSNYAPMYKDTVAFDVCGRTKLNDCSADGAQYSLRLNSSVPNSIIFLINFMARHAADYVSEADMIAAGGFFIFDIETGVSYILHSVNCDFEIGYTGSYGKFINDSEYNRKDIFNSFRFINSYGTSRTYNMINYLGDIDSDSLITGAAIIPDNSDLNDYKSPGIFKSPGGVHTQTMSNVPPNAPFSNSGFVLEVKTYGYLTQTLHSPTVNPAYTETVAYRQYNGSVWGDWLYY